MFRRLCGLWVVVACLTTANVWAQSGAIEDTLGRGITAYFRGQPDAAEQLLSTVIDSGSQDPQAFYFRGLAKWRQGRTDEARADFTAGAKHEAVSGSLFRTSAKSLERVQGPARMALQQIRQAERVATTTQREKERLAKFDIRTATPPVEAIAGTTATPGTPAAAPTSNDPFAPKPAAPASNDPFAPKAAMPAPTATASSTPAAPAADPFAPKPATPMPTTPPATTPATTAPAAATTAAASSTTPTAPALAPAKVIWPDEPVACVKALLGHLYSGRLAQAWQYLTPKQQADVKDVIKEYAAHMDKDFYNKGFTTLRLAMKVLKEKKDFILNAPQLAAFGPPPEAVVKAWEPTVTAVDDFLNSDIGDLERLSKIDIEQWLAGPASNLAKHFLTLYAGVEGVTVDEVIEKIAQFEPAVKVLNNDGKVAEVEITAPNNPPFTVIYKLHEGRWQIAALVDNWDEQVTSVKTTFANFDVQKQLPQANLFITTIEGLINQLDKAQDQEAFNKVVDQVVGAAKLLGVLPQAPATQQPNM